MPSTNENKNKLTKGLGVWLKKYLDKEFSSEYNVSVEIPISNLDKLENEKVSKLTNVNLMIFHPDILGILEHKQTKQVELVFIFRDTATIGFTLIGEILIYCRLVNPKIAMLVSTKNLSDKVDEWINHKKNHSIISYHNKKIIIFKWDLETSLFDKYSITPIEARDSLSH